MHVGKKCRLQQNAKVFHIISYIIRGNLKYYCGGDEIESLNELLSAQCVAFDACIMLNQLS